PSDSPIQDFVYRFCYPSTYVDVIYEHCDSARWRRLLLENVLGRGWWRLGPEERLLAYARRDSDDICRELGHTDASIRGPRRAVFRRALRVGDAAALRGLAKNRSLSPRQLAKLARRGIWQAATTLEAVQRPHVERAEPTERGPGWQGRLVLGQ